MARAQPGFSLKDQLFNAASLGDLADAYAAAVPGFDREAFLGAALSGVPERTLLACLDWFADCLEPYLAADFPAMADQLEAPMPPPLDPSRSDDDFGRFIHAVPGVLAVRHGLEAHRDRALDLLYAATQRFSMEFYIRPFLDRWPEDTLARLRLWARDDNYHVRRLVSEGTRPRLPWARNLSLSSAQTLPLLDLLEGDRTRYVTRSVANHLNDIAKTEPDAVLERLSRWSEEGRQRPDEHGWMRRHALRTLIKDGHAGAMALLGYARDLDLDIQLTIHTDPVPLGSALGFAVTITSPADAPVIVDYRIRFARPGGRSGEKVFKLKTTRLRASQPLALDKTHRLKAAATTFELHPGPHTLTVQINGQDRASGRFDVTAP